MDHDRQGDRLRSFLLGGVLGASAAIATARRRRRRARHRGEPRGLRAIEGAPSNREAVRELKALGLWKENRMDHEDVDLTDEQLRMIPGLIRDSVAAEFQKVLAPRPDELDDAEVYRFMREDFPSIVHAAMVAHIRSEVEVACRRLQGKVD